ncbi:MAG TPA: type IV toxin-antitoxin system AbiEi family antitoxin domain-containing protein [Ilumatobacteraceae bacterium]|nr:type IV toxin-antitoxin system AbiEi family antitoxin domain-containing protein [Ilumatobacteraceae bacterium]
MFNTESLQVAARQFGTITRRQLHEHGASSSAISRARCAGLLIEVVPGVLRFASSPETFMMRCMAVQHATAPGGYLSGWTAGRLYGLRKMPESPIHVTVPTSTNRSLPAWVECHRSSWFDEGDLVTRPDGLRVAEPMRMLFALGASFNQFRFERSAEDAWHLGLVTPSDAMDYLERHRCRGKDGVATMERWLERTLSRARPTQSDLERIFLEALARRSLPEPETQFPLELLTGEVIHLDIAWPDIRLAVEPGSSWWHGGDAGQRNDQQRDRACTEVGWLTLRFDETLRDDPDAAAQQVERVHRRRANDLRNLPRSNR